MHVGPTLTDGRSPTTPFSHSTPAIPRVLPGVRPPCVFRQTPMIAHAWGFMNGPLLHQAVIQRPGDVQGVPPERGNPLVWVGWAVAMAPRGSSQDTTSRCGILNYRVRDRSR